MAKNNIIKVIFLNVLIGLSYWFIDCSEPTRSNVYFERFPLKTGNSWIYSVDNYYKDTDPDSNVFSDKAGYSYFLKMSVINDSVMDNNSMIFDISEHEYLIENGSEITLSFAGTSLINSDSGLFRVAETIYNYSGSREPILKGIASINQADPLTFESKTEISPRTILQYPLEVGAIWNFYRSTPDTSYDPMFGQVIINNSTSIISEVIDIETVNVPAGKFRCYKIESYYDIDGDGIYDEEKKVTSYINEKGLIKKEVVLIGYPAGSGGWGGAYYLRKCYRLKEFKGTFH